MGTKKGMRRKTARRAYEPRRRPVFGGYSIYTGKAFFYTGVNHVRKTFSRVVFGDLDDFKRVK